MAERVYNAHDLAYLIQRGCSQKDGYSSRRRAKAAARHARARKQRRFRVYGPCVWCGEWHLTTRGLKM